MIQSFAHAGQLPDETEQQARQLAQIMAECLELFQAKNRDYGSSWKKAGLPGLLVRMQDKIERMVNLSRDGSTIHVKTESLEDTLRDFLVYAGLALMYLREVQR